MTGQGIRGFDYHVEDDVILRYMEKPLELRLAWLYMGAVFRKDCPPETIERQEICRRGIEAREPNPSD